MSNQSGRVEQNENGWYNTNAEEEVPMLMDVYNSTRFIPSYKDLQRRVKNLERRGA